MAIDCFAPFIEIKQASRCQDVFACFVFNLKNVRLVPVKVFRNLSTSLLCQKFVVKLSQMRILQNYEGEIFIFVLFRLVVK